MDDEIERRLRQLVERSDSTARPAADPNDGEIAPLREIDRVLGVLLHDSAASPLAGVRSGSTSLDRQILFEGGGLTIVVDVAPTDDDEVSITGQVLGHFDVVSVQAVDADEIELGLTVADDFGQFDIAVPRALIQLIVSGGSSEIIIDVDLR
jgi:hypothetical protein